MNKYNKTISNLLDFLKDHSSTIVFILFFIFTFYILQTLFLLNPSLKNKKNLILLYVILFKPCNTL